MEEWKKIPNFSNYLASKSGNIKNNITQQTLNPSSKVGYISVHISNDQGKSKSIGIHILVAKTWIPNPENKPTVNHINKKRNDNRVDNLEWATHQEQAKHRIEFNKRRPLWKCNLETKEKIQLYKTLKDAANDVTSDANKISKAARGIIQSAYGFYWIYDDLDKKDKPNEKWKIYKKIRKNIYYISNCGHVKNI